MERIILVQHCQSEHHINDMSGGWTDSVLTILGEEQAGRVANKLMSFFVEDREVSLYSSDLLRASQTAAISR